MRVECCASLSCFGRGVKCRRGAMAGFRSLAAALPLLLLCAALLIPGQAKAAGQATKADPHTTPAARVTMEIGKGGFVLSAAGGRGVLTFQGRKYAFKVGGLGVGGFGVAKINAVGEVYNLRHVEDFPGAFFQAEAGYAIGEGKGVQWLANSNGVKLKLRSTTKGVTLNLGADGLVIEMGPIKKR
jgi:hypothetical protein